MRQDDNTRRYHSSTGVFISRARTATDQKVRVQRVEKVRYLFTPAS